MEQLLSSWRDGPRFLTQTRKSSIRFQFGSDYREFWNQASLGDIGRVLGSYIEANLSFQQTRIRKVARILVSLNIRTNLWDDINLIWGTKTRKKLLDYEWIPFRCHKCHEMWHLAKNCPNYVPSTTWRKKWSKKEEKSLRPKDTSMDQGMEREQHALEVPRQPLGQTEELVAEYTSIGPSSTC